MTPIRVGTAVVGLLNRGCVERGITRGVTRGGEMNPFAHVGHVPRAAFMYVPAAQAVQAMAEWFAAIHPSGHCLHATSAVSRKSPISHRVQLTRAIESAVQPVGHALHMAAAAASLYRPAAQLVHALRIVSLSPRNLPCGQLVHACAIGAEKRPCEHGRHAAFAGSLVW